MKFSQVALLGAVTVVAAQHHNHLHRHPARHGSPVAVRNPAAVEVAGPTITVYELDGQDISYSDVEEGLKDGKYVLISDSSSSVAPSTTAEPTTSSTSTPTPTPTPSSSVVAAAEFIQQKSSSSSTTSEEPTPTPAPTTSATPTPTPTPASSSDSSSSSSSESASSSGSSSSSSSGSSSGSWPDFPSGTISCDSFPSEYGAVAVDYLGFNGWSGIQYITDFTFDISLSNAISQIATAISGDGCKASSFCSYACGAGEQKIQWPKSQGATGQSIGGLWCNENGFLELTREGVSQICGAGAGGVQVKNSLDTNVPICRTDYPGTESETIPLDTQAGQTYPLTNPNTADYYTWEGSSTSAQYYINPKGSAVSDACTWNSPGSNLGNYAPGNIGVGQSGGITYISMFPNHPSNPDGTMDYNIKITGSGLIGDCEYKNGAYYSNGAEMANGCTVSVPSGGNALFEFY